MKDRNHMRVLLIEDDALAARGTSLMLRAAGASVDCAATGDEGIEFARCASYDIILLDLLLPDMEGYEVVRRLRAARAATPIVMLSGLARLDARVRALDLGADDFLVKPFDRAELVARMGAVVRRSHGMAHPVIEVGPLRLDTANQDVTYAGRHVDLTGKEYAVLKLLAQRRGAIITKEHFLNSLYGGMDEPEGKIIDVFICKLRKKLARAGGDGLISTVWGSGYVLRAHKAASAPEMAEAV